MAKKKTSINKKPAKTTVVSKRKAITPVNRKFPIVALGASAGGLEAFESFFKSMNPNSGIAFILVAHLDPTHVSLLPELIQRNTKMKVHQAKDGVKVERNNIYVIPPNKNLEIMNGSLQLFDLTKPRGFNLPIDSFFRSLAKDQGPNAVCIILSGTGTDGTLGLKAIKGEVGMVMVQDEKSAKYDGMPRSALSTGLADYVLTPEQMPEQLIEYTKHTFHKKHASITPDTGKISNALQKIYIVLRTQTDHDFTHYKKNTIYRRIERRMNVHQIGDMSEYVKYLQNSEFEVSILFKELLIGVTNFFRDADGFDVLQKQYLKELLKDKPDDYTIRVWVPGCSSGEEAYSLAIILHEAMTKAKHHYSIQIFGTDIDADSINFARAGLYPKSIIADVSSERLKRYFTEEDGSYRVKKIIREMLVFAPQNVIKDPPFTKLDILSCRNLLIYLDPELQKRLMPVFHYCLRDYGILFLGSSETVGQATDMFSLQNKRWKIYKKLKSAAGTLPVIDFPPSAVKLDDEEPIVPNRVKKAEEFSTIQLVETILQQTNTPTCAIIDDACNIIYIHGRTGHFLEPAEGKISVNILEMARSGLKESLATAIRKVAVHKQEIIEKGLKVNHDDGSIFLDLSVKPILGHSVLRGLMMVIFNETEKQSKRASLKSSIERKKLSSKSADDLERELKYTKENLQTTIDELETSNEELQSTNEELQSTNEEMETSKEELQSLNEESATVNAELQSRIDELAKANDDMKNLLDSTDIATLFLDTDLCIRRFTPKATAIIPLVGTDLGRPITHFATNLIDADISEYGTRVLNDLTPEQVDVKTSNGKIINMKVRPYRTVNNVIDGVVVTFEDISERIQAKQVINDARKYALSVAETVREPLVVLDSDLRVICANHPFYRTFNVKPEVTEGQMIYDLGNRQWNIPRLRKLLDDILPLKTSILDFEVEHKFENIGQRRMLLNASRIFGGSNDTMIILAIEDITDRNQAETKKSS